MPVATSSSVDEASLLLTNKDNDENLNGMLESDPSSSTRQSAEISNKRVFPLFETFSSDSFMSSTAAQSQTSRFSPSADVRENLRGRLHSADRDTERMRALPSCSVTRKSESPPSKRPRTSGCSDVDYNSSITSPGSLSSNDRPTLNAASTKQSTLFSESNSSVNHRGNYPALNSLSSSLVGSRIEEDFAATEHRNVDDDGSTASFLNVPPETEIPIIDLTNVEESDLAEEEENHPLSSPTSYQDSYGGIRFRSGTPIPERGFTIPCVLSSPPGYLYSEQQSSDEDVGFQYASAEYETFPGVGEEAEAVEEQQPYESDGNQFEALGAWSRRLREPMEEDTVIPQQIEQNDRVHPGRLRHTPTYVLHDTERRGHRRISRYLQPTSLNVSHSEAPQQYPLLIDRLQYPSVPSPAEIPSLPFRSYGSNGARGLPGPFGVGAPFSTRVLPVLSGRNRPPASTQQVQPANSSLYSSHFRHFTSHGTEHHAPVLRPIPSLQQAHTTRREDLAALPYSQHLPGAAIPQVPTLRRDSAHAFPAVSPTHRPSDVFQPSRQFPVSSRSDRLRQVLNNNDLNGATPRPWIPLTTIRPAALDPPSYMSPRRVAAETDTTRVSYSSPRRPPSFNPWQYLPSTASMRPDTPRREPSIPDTSLPPQPRVPTAHPMATSFPIFSGLPPWHHDYHSTDILPPPSPQGFLNRPVNQAFPLPFSSTRTNRFMPLHPYVSLEDESDSNPFDILLSLAEGLGGVKPQGLSKGRIDQLSSYRYKPGTHRTDQPMCVVCMCEWEQKDHIRVLPCDHEFHAKCVDKWLKKNRTCPICRGDAGQCETSAPALA